LATLAVLLCIMRIPAIRFLAVLIPIDPAYLPTIEAAQGIERSFGTDRRTTKMANGIVASYKSWLKYRQTCNELNRLTNRELDDLGIRRADIASLARQSAGY